jgi:tetratricopeptide (TPR) repeat protein
MVAKLVAAGHDDELRRVRAVLFLSTPAQGAPIADVASWLSMNPQLKDLRPSDFNTLLQVFENDWSDVMRARDRLRESYPQAYCAYETLPTNGVRVVTRLYATSRCDNTPYGMDYDHSGIVKPADQASDPYPWAKARFQQADKLAEFSQIPSAAAIADTPQFKEIQSARSPAPEVAKWSNALGDTYANKALGSTAPSTRDLRSALVAYQTAAGLDPKNALYPAKMASSQSQLGQHLEAIENFRRAISLDPTVGWYHGELCTALVKAGRTEEAAGECQTALRLEPRNGTYQKQWESLVRPERSTVPVGGNRGRVPR